MTKLPRFHRTKGKKRPEGKPKLDDELVEIALAIDAQRLDAGIDGWFSVPWRDGWNAVSLAHDAADLLPNFARFDEDENTLGHLQRWISKRDASTDAYHFASELLERQSHYVGSTHTKTLHPIVRAGLRCFQIVVARSDAGGAAYNPVLRSAFERGLPDDVADIVRCWRSRDALGSAPSPRRAQMFNLAWRRGLYRAAYAV